MGSELALGVLVRAQAECQERLHIFSRRTQNCVPVPYTQQHRTSKPNLAGG
jgi:hypothetical protein